MQTYPIFRSPEKYLALRQGRRRGWLERRALDRCLDGAGPLSSVCDAPAGPGRLYAHWRRLGVRVIGVDLSEPMVEAARRVQASLSLPGQTLSGDLFALEGLLPEKPDLVACVRFAYYFDAPQRIALLRALACASRRWVLIQFLTDETLRGGLQSVRTRARRRRVREGRMSRRLCTFADVTRELGLAGLRLVRAAPVSEFSARLFVLAEKVPEGVVIEPSCAPRLRSRWDPRGWLARAVPAAYATLLGVRRGPVPGRRARPSPTA